MPRGGPQDTCVYVSGPSVSLQAIYCDELVQPNHSTPFSLEEIVDNPVDGAYTFRIDVTDQANVTGSANATYALAQTAPDAVGSFEQTPDIAAETPAFDVKFKAGSQIVGQAATVRLMRSGAVDAVATRNVTLAATNSLTFAFTDTEDDYWVEVDYQSPAAGIAAAAVRTAASRRVTYGPRQLARAAAWYVKQGTSGTGLQHACDRGRSAAQNVTPGSDPRFPNQSITTLIFGPQRGLDSEGTSVALLAGLPRQNVSIPLDDVVKIGNAFVRCWYANRKPAAKTFLVLSTTNDLLLNNDRDVRGQPSPAQESLNRQQGSDWARVVKEVFHCAEGSGSDPQAPTCTNTTNMLAAIEPQGATDQEIGFSSVYAAEQWQNGYFGNAGRPQDQRRIQLLNIGDAAGCQMNNSLCITADNSTSNDYETRRWAKSAVYRLAWGKDPLSFVMPQMYLDGQAQNWNAVVRANLDGVKGRICFSGVTSGGRDINPQNSFVQSFNALRRVLPASAVDCMERKASDFKYIDRPWDG